MKNEIIFASLAIILVLSLIPSVNAVTVSGGIVPLETTVTLEQNTSETVQFTVSVGSAATGTEAVTLYSSTPSWLTLDQVSFNLGPGQEKQVTATIAPLPGGNYSSEITVEFSAYGFTSSGKAKVYVISTLASLLPEAKIQTAQNKIKAANNTIYQTKGVGGNTTEAESMLLRAISEFDVGNYDNAITYADTAYTLAYNEYVRITQQKPPEDGGFDFIEFLTSPTGIILIAVILVLIVAAIGLSRRKPKHNEEPRLAKPEK